MAAFRSQLILRQRWSLLLTLVAFVLALIAGSILWYSVETSSVSEIQMRIDAAKRIFTGIRLFLIAAVAMVWPFLVRGLHRCGRIDKVQRSTLEALHWRVVVWLVVIELVLGQNLLGQVLTVLYRSSV